MKKEALLKLITAAILALSSYVGSKTIDNEKDIARLKEADKYQVKQLDEIHKDVKTILKKVK